MYNDTTKKQRAAVIVIVDTKAVECSCGKIQKSLLVGSPASRIQMQKTQQPDTATKAMQAMRILGGIWVGIV